MDTLRTLLVTGLLVLAGACGGTVSPYARATAGRIGCPATQIELTQVERDGGGPQSWVAYCGPTGYACSSSRPLDNPRTRVVCSELGHPSGRHRHGFTARRHAGHHHVD